MSNKRLVLGGNLQITDGLDFKNYKAPKGFQFLLKSISFSIGSIENATFVGLFLLDHEITHADFVPLRPIAAILAEPDTQGGNIVNTIMVANHQIPLYDFPTKYFSIMNNSQANQLNAMTIVHADLVPMSQQEEIWEFVAKAVI